MDDLVVTLLFVFGLAAIGWCLGIAGYFKAKRALEELAELRAMIGPVGQAMGQPIGQPAGQGDDWGAVPADEIVADEPLPLSASVAPSAPELGDSDRPAGPSSMASRPAEPRRGNFEELLTAKWGVWLGAATLLLAGVFLVRYAVDEGLLGPGVRAVAMVLLSLALIAGAEFLSRSSRLPGAADADRAVLPDYAPQALAAGAGAMLFGAAYLAGPLYDLVPRLVGFCLMALAGLTAMVLSLRYGPLSVAVGIIGAFITPLLIGRDEPFLAGLFAYLFCVATAALAVMRYTAWVWVGWATTAACGLWVLLMIALAGSAADLWPVGLFVPAVVLAHLLLLPAVALDQPVGRRVALLPFVILGLMALLLTLAVPGWQTRLGVLLLVPIALILAGREQRLMALPWLAAGLFILLLLGWGLPDWRPADWSPYGQPITTDGVIMGFLPGAWAPEVLQPLLLTAGLTAALFALAGLWGERRCPAPVGWVGLTAAVPVLTLALLYLRVRLFETDFAWAGVSLWLAAALTLAAKLALDRREGADGAAGRQIAGLYGAGAAAALTLACAMVLTDQWLTLAIALLLPVLGWIEAQCALPVLRRVTLALTVVAMIRLLGNPYVLVYGPDSWPLFNGVTPVYLLAAAAAAVTAGMLRRRGDDLTVAVLEMAAVAFITALVLLEIRRFASNGHPEVADSSFLELALHVTALATLATVGRLLASRVPRPVLAWAWKLQGLAALIGGILLLLANPFLIDLGPLGRLPLLNALLPAYGLPALVAAIALYGAPAGQPLPARRLLGLYALVASFSWVTLEVRHLFHPYRMDLFNDTTSDVELWVWSGAWLAYGLALMAGGIITRRASLRLAAMAIVALAAAKVFLVDLSGLVGLWRVLSLLGLGLTLIALGAVHHRFVIRPGREA